MRIRLDWIQVALKLLAVLLLAPVIFHLVERLLEAWAG